MACDLSFISSSDLVDYDGAVSIMERYVYDIKSSLKHETVWFLEHPPLYTAGTSANDSDIIDKNRFPIYKTGRGGQYTYHGPNQLICYIMINIQDRKIGVREYIQLLEKSIIDTLAYFNINGFISEGRVGVWVIDNNIESKIAAIGVRIRRGITYHGLAINIAPDLSAFNSIVPCGIKEYGVTSIEKLGINCTRKEIEEIFKEKFLNNLKKITDNFE